MRFDTQLSRLLKRSVITGIPQIITAKGITRKLLKCIVFFGCVGGFLYQTFYFLQLYWAYPTVVDVTVSNPAYLEMPAVTFCNFNGLVAGSFCEKYGNFCTPIADYEDFYGRTPFSYTGVGEDKRAEDEDLNIPCFEAEELPKISRGEYKEMGYSADYLIDTYKIKRLSEWKSYYRISDQTQWVGVTGALDLPNNCYAFQSVWGNASKEPEIVLRNTKLYYVIKMDEEENFYAGIPFALQLAIHSPYTLVNPFADGFTLKPCLEYIIYFEKTEKHLLPAPYATNCTDYMELWKARGGVGPLTDKSCAEECIRNASLKESDCPSRNYISLNESEFFCPDTKEFLEVEILLGCVKMCNQPCHVNEYYVVIEKHDVEPYKYIEDYGISCKTYIYVDFSRLKVTNYTYKAKYETIELFSYVGGYLGMWLGISLVAVCDFLEVVVLMFRFLMNKLKRKKGRKKFSKIKLFGIDQSAYRHRDKLFKRLNGKVY